MIDTAENLRIEKRHWSKIDLARGGSVVVSTVVEANGGGLALVDGELSSAWGRAAMPSGRGPHRARCQDGFASAAARGHGAGDPQLGDRVGIRVTLTAFTRIVDPGKASMAASDVNGDAIPADPVRHPRGRRVAHAR